MTCHYVYCSHHRRFLAEPMGLLSWESLRCTLPAPYDSSLPPLPAFVVQIFLDLLSPFWLPPPSSSASLGPSQACSTKRQSGVVDRIHSAGQTLGLSSAILEEGLDWAVPVHLGNRWRWSWWSDGSSHAPMPQLHVLLRLRWRCWCQAWVSFGIVLTLRYVRIEL